MRGFLRLLAWSAFTVSVILGVVGGVGYWLYRDVTAPGPLAEARTMVIPPHTGLAEIAALLAEHGVIRHPRSFELGARLSGRSAPASGDGHHHQRQDRQAPPDDPRGADEGGDLGAGAGRSRARR